MSEFLSFVDLGFHHIADPRAFDHLLFIFTLCAVYRVAEWRQLLVLVTAFTIGHSATLVMSGMQWLSVPSKIVETLIPVTILLTSIYNIAVQRGGSGKQLFSKTLRWNYALALVFGFIHGMGFANYFNMLMGEDSSIVWPLFSFNVGIELGQMAIVGAFFALHFLLEKIVHFQHRDWNQYVSGLGGGGALVLLLQNLLG